MKTTLDDLARIADALGYERVAWDADNGCYSGYGAADPYDRSRDDGKPRFVAWTAAELAEIVNATPQPNTD